MHPQDIQYVNEPLADILDLAGRELICLAGAGGKTTLMWALAGELSLAGQRVIVTTTTHIIRPSGEVILEPDPKALLAKTEGVPLPGQTLTLAGGQNPSVGGLKLSGLEPETVDLLWNRGAAEYILVEADGSKRRPIKAPREREPVIPIETTVLVGVIGLSALDREADEEVIFGFDRFREITGIRPGERIGPDHAAALILHDQGLFKSAPPEARKVVFLNQTESEKTRTAALDTIAILGRNGFRARVVLGSLKYGLLEVYDLDG